MAKRLSRKRPWLLAVLALLAMTLVALALAWVFRKPAAAWMAERWCRSQQFECSLEVAALGPDGLEIRNLHMKGPDGSVPLEAASARVDLVWPDFLSPAPRQITVTSPVLRARYVSEGDTPVRFGGLENLVPSSSAPSANPPAISVTAARIELETPAGPVVMTGRFSGKLPYQGEVFAEIEPVELVSGDDRLTLREGRVDLSFTGLKIDGTASLDLVEADFEGLSARNARLSLDMAGTLQPAAAWTARVDQLSYRNISLSGGDFSGDIKARRPGLGPREGLLAGIGSLLLSGTIETLAHPSIAAGHTGISLDANRHGGDGLTADFALDAQDLRHEHVSARRATLSGQASFDDSVTAADARADLVLEGASLSQAMRGKVTKSVSMGPPLKAHTDALARWLDMAASQFSLGTGLEARWSKDGNWSLVSNKAVTARGAGGATLTFAPQDTQPAINLSSGSTELSGLLNLAGGSAPHLAALIHSLRFGEAAPLQAETGGVSLKPWTAGGLTFSADLNEIELSASGSAPRLKTVGEIRVDGPLYGMTHTDTRVFGGIDAVFDTAGVRIQAFRTRCLGLDTSAVQISGGFGIRDTALQLCPVDGRVVSRSNGVASGRFELGTVSVPFASQSTEGVLSLEQATLDWRAGDKAAITIESARMNLPLAIGGETLVISSSAPTLGLESGQPAQLSARVGASEFSGSVLPADVSLASATLDALLAPAGLQGSARASNVEMRDRSLDPLYEPLTGELTAEFLDGVMTVRGPVTTPHAGRTIANVELMLDLDTLDGQGQVTTPTLVFEPGRLQPTALSERVRGFLSNARGQLSGQAHFDINGGKPSGTGWVSVSDFGFDTLRVGAVRGVEGRIDFDDVLSLSTPPGQEVRIGQINPGVPLEDGLVVFQLLSASEAILERARWPFAGGELAANRSDWTIAGTSDVILIDASSLELTSLISIFNLPDIKAEGTVSGTFPVEIAGPNAYIRNATLTADNKGGIIAYTGNAADSASLADSRAKLAFDALRDFRFSVLEIGADGNLSGDMLITLKLAGYSPGVLDGAPFAFNIGVDSKLMQLIQTGRRATSSDWLADIVSESVSGRNPVDDARAE